MNESRANYTIALLRNYRYARRFGWLSLCLFQFVMIVPAYIIIFIYAVVSGAQAVAEYFVENASEVNPLSFLYPNYRDPEKDALLAEAYAALEEATPTTTNNTGGNNER